MSLEDNEEDVKPVILSVSETQNEMPANNNEISSQSTGIPSISDVVRMLTSSPILSTASCSKSSSDTPVRKRRRLDSYENPTSVHSSTSTVHSDDSSSMASCSTPAPSAPKRRGRPPKTESTPISPSQLKHLNETDLRYFQMRNKNNEASRRSRVNRKDREQQIEDEGQELESKYLELTNMEASLERDCKKWKNAVMKLACL